MSGEDYAEFHQNVHASQLARQAHTDPHNYIYIYIYIYIFIVVYMGPCEDNYNEKSKKKSIRDANAVESSRDPPLRPPPPGGFHDHEFAGATPHHHELRGASVHGVRARGPRCVDLVAMGDCACGVVVEWSGMRATHGPV